MGGCLLKHFSYLISFGTKESIFLFMGEGNLFTDFPNKAVDSGPRWINEGRRIFGEYGESLRYDDVGIHFLVSTFVI